MKNIDRTILESLSPKERELALQILEEYGKKGASDTHDALLYQDYIEKPVDIMTFITDDRYLGYAWKDNENKLKVFPYWVETLKKAFPDNISTSINTILASGARGIGKTEIGVLCMMYMMHRLMCLKDPLGYYGLKPTEKFVFAMLNIKLDLAEEIALSKFQKTVQLSPWFLERGNIRGRVDKVWEPLERYNIDIKIGSQADDVLGLPVFFAFFDEISFIRNQDIDVQKRKAIEMIDTAIASMKTRFARQGFDPTLLYLASSKRTEQSFMEQHMRKKLDSEPDNVIIIDDAIWNIVPRERYSEQTFNVALGNKFLVSQVLKDKDDPKEWIKKGYTILQVPIDFRAQFIDNIDKSLRDYAGRSSTDLSKYISGAAVEDCINRTRSNPFVKDVIEVGNAEDDKAQYKDFFDITKINKDNMNKPLFIHLDMSISGDKTGIAGLWIKGKKPSEDPTRQEKDLLFELAFSVSIKAPKGRQISFEKNRNFIRWLREQGFLLKEITCDTFQSYDLIQQLTAEGFNIKIQSVDRVDKVSDTNSVNRPYQFFRNVIYEKRIDMYESNLLIEEIVNLERNANNGKIDHPSGGSKDASDAVCGALFTASKYAEEFAFSYGESYDSFFEVNQTEAETSLHEMTVDFEEEMKKVHRAQSNIIPDDYFFGDDSFVADGVLIW